MKKKAMYKMLSLLLSVVMLVPFMSGIAEESRTHNALDSGYSA